MKDVLEKIKTRGHWIITIHPSEFIENRIDALPKCREIIRDLAVRYRGWDYPYHDEKSPSAGIDYVEQSVDWQDRIEYWRYYQSGQFVHYLAMWEDWQDQRTLWGSAFPYKPGDVLSVISGLFQCTEIYEFASRLTAKKLLGENCKISIDLVKTKNRTLVLDEPGRYPLMEKFICHMDKVPKEQATTSEELMGKSHQLALEHAFWIFERFNWDNIPKSVFKEDQNKLISGIR